MSVGEDGPRPQNWSGASPREDAVPAGVGDGVSLDTAHVLRDGSSSVGSVFGSHSACNAGAEE